MIGTNTPSPQRFVLAAVLTLLAACGGGGGGSSDTLPTIVTASFVGATATPAAGDTLLLAFSETVAVVAGKLLTDADFVLSAGATLGDVTAAPSQLGDNVLSITLGAGVTLLPGTTTIALGAANDAVRDAGGKLGNGGSPVTIGTSDGAAPTLSNVTIAAIDGALNGTGPAGGTLQVPARGWTIDLTYADNTAVATAQTQIAASVTVNTGSGAKPAGTNLVPFLSTVAAGATSASYRVPSDVTFPNGPLTLTCIVVDASGLSSTPGTFAATVRAFSNSNQPFETNVNPSQVWFLDFTRDIESYTTSGSPGSVSVDVVAGPSGTSDFEELLRILGLTSATPIANVIGAQNSNDVVMDQFKAALLAQLAVLYSGANVTFTLTRPSGTFGSSSSVGYSSFGYSQISIAGAASSTGVLGLAIFDPSNTNQNDDTRTDFAGSLRLGIFLHTIIDDGMQSNGASLFRMTFDPFATSQGGTPIGNNSNDGMRLTGALSDTRADAIDTAIADLARFTAVVTAHECGHSVGLVVNGAMPTGLYGNDTVNFPGSSDGHIRNMLLFPAGSTNVMSPALSYSAAVNAASGFNSLNLAYLREQVFYGN